MIDLINMLYNGNSIINKLNIAVFIVFSILFSIYIVLKMKIKSKIKNYNISLKDFRNFSNIEKEKIEITNLSELIKESVYLSKFDKKASKKKKANQSITYNEIEDEIYNDIYSAEPIIKTILSSFTVVGLLFTFLGLTLAVFESVSLLKDLDNFDHFMTGMEGPLDSMALAFVSSIIGLFLTLLLGFINTIWNKSFDTTIKKHVDLIVYDFLPNYAPETSEIQIENNFTKLQNGMADLFKSFGINQFKVLKEFSDNIDSYFNKFENRNKEYFNNLLVKFENSSASTEANVKELVTKIGESNNKFSSLVTTLKDNSKNFTKSSKTLTESSKNIEKASSAFNEHIENFNNLSQPFNDVSEKFSIFMDGLDNFIDNLNSKNEDKTELMIDNISKRLNGFTDLVNSMKSQIENSEFEYNSLKEGISQQSDSIKKSLDFTNNQIINQKEDINKSISIHKKDIDENLSSLDEKYDNLKNDISQSQVAMNKIKLDTDNSNNQILNKILLLDKKIITNNHNKSIDELSNKSPEKTTIFKILNKWFFF